MSCKFLFKMKWNVVANQRVPVVHAISQSRVSRQVEDRLTDEFHNHELRLTLHYILCISHLDQRQGFISNIYQLIYKVSYITCQQSIVPNDCTAFVIGHTLSINLSSSAFSALFAFVFPYIIMLLDFTSVSR